MKKNCIWILLFSVLLLVACGQGESGNSNAGSSAKESSMSSDATGVGDSHGVSDTQEPVLSRDPNAGKDHVPGETIQSISYTWQELTIAIPTSWQDTCLFLEEEDGFAIYQKASYEKDRSGYICRFLRTTEYFNYGAGDTLMAYTDSGTLYYLMRPTDVACDSRDEAILSEYIDLCGEVDAVKDSLEIAASDVHRNTAEYVLPVSSIMPITRDAILNFTDNDLWIARNEIYARHGREFTNSYLQMYFEQCTWYKGTIAAVDFDEKVLSQVERDNIALLVEAEAAYDAEHPYPQRCEAMDTVFADLHGDGTDNIIGYHVKHPENEEVQSYITIDGTSYLVNDLVPLWYPVEEVFYISDILEGDGALEIALLDYGPSDDPMTYFFRLEESLVCIGRVSGYPFPEENRGVNGIDGFGRIAGQGFVNLIETAAIKSYWRYDREQECIVFQELGWYEYLPNNGHALYVDLPVRCRWDANSALITIPAQEKVYFVGTDNREWILVKGKDGSQGYMQVKDGIIVELNKPAEEVFSDLYFFG